MQKLSPHYRNDEDTGLDPDIQKYLDDTYLANLPNIDRHNPKLLVVFSGGNAMGKTTISTKIRDELGGIMIENDEIKRTIQRQLPDIDKDTLNRLTWQYSMNLYGRLGGLTQNGLIVRDGVIDWYYDRILPVFERAGYPLFIIGFDIPREKAVELIKRRGDTPTVKEERFYALLDDHEIHMERFRRLYTPDVLLTETNIFDHKMVLSKLKEQISKLR